MLDRICKLSCWINIQRICPRLPESQIFQSSYLLFWYSTCFQIFWSVVHFPLFRSIAYREFYHFSFWVILYSRCVLLYELRVPKICHSTWIHSTWFEPSPLLICSFFQQLHLADVFWLLKTISLFHALHSIC